MGIDSSREKRISRKMKMLIALVLFAVCNAAPLQEDHDHHHDHHHHRAHEAVNAVYSKVALNSINAKGAKDSLNAKFAMNAAAAKYAEGSMLARHAKYAGEAEHALNAKYAFRAMNAKYAGWARHAAHISPTFPPKNHSMSDLVVPNVMPEAEKDKTTTTITTNHLQS